MSFYSPQLLLLQLPPLNVSIGTLIELTGPVYNFFFYFLWGDYRLTSGDASVSGERVPEVIAAEIQTCIPSSSKTLFHVIHGSAITALRPFSQGTRLIESGKKRILLPPTSISSLRIFEIWHREAKRPFIQNNNKDLLSSPIDTSFWSLAKRISDNFYRACSCLS